MAILERFSEHEDGLIRQFHKLPFFQRFSHLSDAELRAFLIQKWFLSLNFVPWYDRAINALSDSQAKEVLKRIVQDETPKDAPSHREDLLADLEYVGISKGEVLTAKPTKSTIKAMDRIIGLTNLSDDLNYNLKVMVALRTAGEILVAEEYRHVVPELERRYGLTADQSRFYAPHFYHDRKDSETGQHTHSFESVLERMIDSEPTLAVAMKSADEAFKARTSFYNQFDKRLGHRKLMVGTGALSAAAAVVIAVAGQFYNGSNNNSRIPEGMTVVDSSGIYTLERDANKWLINRYKQTGEQHYLDDIGKRNVVERVFGPGP